MTEKNAAQPESKPAATNLITVKTLASLLMITEQWVRQLAGKGYIPKPDRGNVPLIAGVQGYIRFLKDEERRTSKTASQSAVAEARAREITLRTAREEGRLIDIEDAEAVFAEVLGTFRAELAGVAAASTRDLELRAAIDGRLNDAIARCRARFETAGASARAGSGYSLSDEAAAA